MMRWDALRMHQKFEAHPPTPGINVASNLRGDVVVISGLSAWRYCDLRGRILLSLPRPHFPFGGNVVIPLLK